VAERPPPIARDRPRRASSVTALVGDEDRAGRAYLDQVDVGGVRAGQVDGAQPCMAAGRVVEVVVARPAWLRQVSCFE
jgi:hypothetical protein